MRLSKQKILSLSIRHRLSIGTVVVERVLDLYSTYFVKKYKQDLIIEYLWSFISGQRVSEHKRDEFVEYIGSNIDMADQEGYGFRTMAMGVELLEEIQYQRGENVIVALDNAAWAFACQQLYRQKLSDGDPRIPIKYIESLGMPVHDASIKAYGIAREYHEKKISRDLFSSVQIELDAVPPFLKKEELLKVKGARLGPPIHEVKR